MKTSMYIRLQKRYGGNWVSTNKTGEKIYAASDDVTKVLDQLKKKKISPQKTVIGYIERYGQISAYLSISILSHTLQLKLLGDGNRYGFC